MAAWAHRRSADGGGGVPGSGVGESETNEGNGLRGYLQRSSAREIKGWGSAASSPQRWGESGWRGEGWRLQREGTVGVGACWGAT